MNEVGTKVASEKIETSDLSDTMKTANGRAVIWRVLQASGVDSDTFSQDPYRHAYIAGKRSVGVWLLNEIRATSPGEVITMYKENSNA